MAQSSVVACSRSDGCPKGTTASQALPAAVCSAKGASPVHSQIQTVRLRPLLGSHSTEVVPLLHIPTNKCASSGSRIASWPRLCAAAAARLCCDLSRCQRSAAAGDGDCTCVVPASGIASGEVGEEGDKLRSSSSQSGRADSMLLLTADAASVAGAGAIGLLKGDFFMVRRAGTSLIGTLKA